MHFKVASYNIHKAVGLDRRRDPERIMAVLRSVDADIVALQEADRRFGDRVSALPLSIIQSTSDYVPVQLATRPHSIGWHGNAIFVRKRISVSNAMVVPLPMLEPRGAICAELLINQQPIRVIGMHLDISGLRRRQQVRTIMAHVHQQAQKCETILMGDLNQWSSRGSALREFGKGFTLLPTGNSFHSRRPVVGLDRIIISDQIAVRDCGVHHCALAAKASDHLPIWAELSIGTD